MVDIESIEHEVRLDKWLWACRFFKTRALAHKAIDAGKVSIAGIKVKPGRSIKRGMEVTITFPAGDIVVAVEVLANQRGSAVVAAGYYSETEASKDKRLRTAAANQLAGSTAPSERPHSQDRKEIRRLKETY